MFSLAYIQMCVQSHSTLQTASYLQQHDCSSNWLAFSQHSSAATLLVQKACYSKFYTDQHVCDVEYEASVGTSEDPCFFTSSTAPFKISTIQQRWTFGNSLLGCTDAENKGTDCDTVHVLSSHMVPIFRRLRKIAKKKKKRRRLLASSRPSAKFNTSIFRKSAEKIQVLLKSDKNNGYKPYVHFQS
jgi:hypothetical protein